MAGAAHPRPIWGTSMAKRRNPNPSGKGYHRGRKHAELTPQRIASQRANSQKPRIKLPKAERALLTAKKLSALEFLRSKGLARMREIVEKGAPDVAIRAFNAMADRCGMPIVSEQTVRMETEQPQRIVFEHTDYKAPGSEAETVSIVPLSGIYIGQ
jgi:hypothetical protein